MSPGALPQPIVHSQGIPRGPDKLKTWHLAGLANTFAEQTRINLSARTEPITQEVRVWKKERNLFLVLAAGGGGGKWQVRAFVDLSTHKTDT